ncbi:MAG: DUF2334 domain-containing protein [bacterium]|nr:DUF2334 domain-containing protein [bacterium]
MRNLLYMAVLSIIFIISAFSFYPPNINSNFEITYSKLVRVNESAKIIITSKRESLNQFNFKWETNLGRIESNGSEAVFHAPDSTGEARIKLDIYYGDKLSKSVSFNISIFKQLVILKADDLIYDNTKVISENWTRFLHYVVSDKIKASVGLIVNSLETDDERYSGLLKYLNRTGYIELWIHGYDHRLGAIDPNGEPYDEFRNSSLEFQKEQIKKALDLSKQKLGFTMQTFGAPGNAIDDNTKIALDAFDEIKVWFFGQEGSNKLVLGRSAEMSIR